MSKKSQLPATTEQPQLPAIADQNDFSSMAGIGMENVTSSDILIPRITILQALSPQLKRNNSAHIPGAEEGGVCDVGTGELFPDGLIFLPVYFRKDYLEWAPRASGKGLVGVHGSEIMDQCVPGEKNRPILPNGNYIQETSQFFGLNLSAGRRRSFIPFASTQLKKARRWLTLATGEMLKRADGSEFVAPLFYRTYFLNAAAESNNEGQWYGWTVDRGQSVTEWCEESKVSWPGLREQILSMVDSLKSGQARADVASMDAEQSSPDQERM